MPVSCKECGTVYDTRKEVNDCLEAHNAPPLCIRVKGYWYRRMDLPKDRSMEVASSQSYPSPNA